MNSATVCRKVMLTIISCIVLYRTLKTSVYWIVGHIWLNTIETSSHKCQKRPTLGAKETYYMRTFASLPGSTQ